MFMGNILPKTATELKFKTDFPDDPQQDGSVSAMHCGTGNSRTCRRREGTLGE